MQYNYNKFCNASQLEQEIQASSITIAVDVISTNGSMTTVTMKAALSPSEETILNNLVTAHVVQEVIQQMEVKLVNADIDADERQIVRLAYAKPGWSYMAYPLEFTTAKFDSLHSKDYLGNNRSDITVKFYDSEGAEVTTPGALNVNEASIVRTEVLFKPAYDYEMVSGSIRQDTTATQDVRLWVVGGIIELGGTYVKEFAGGINLRYIGSDEEFKTDGRASKYMKKDIVGVPYQANQIKLILKHPAGLQHKLMITLEFFRA